MHRAWEAKDAVRGVSSSLYSLSSCTAFFSTPHGLRLMPTPLKGSACLPAQSCTLPCLTTTPPTPPPGPIFPAP